MSFGNSYNGGRTKMGTKVFLNLYDLSPMNDCLVPVGFGLHHSGIEISGVEYSFGSGAGIFEQAPREAAGARFRYQLEMGTFEGGSHELNKALDDLRHGGFGSSQYNLVKRNCNHFCDALVWKLLKIRLPGYVNRWAHLGECCACLLPKQLLEDSPVGGSGNRSDGSSSFLVPTSASMKRGGGAKVAPSTQAFSGTGHSLGGESTNASSGWTKSSNASKEDLTDRRERARKAALARLEKSQQQQQEQTQ